jgi:hypothetical protein
MLFKKYRMIWVLQDLDMTLINPMIRSWGKIIDLPNYENEAL